MNIYIAVDLFAIIVLMYLIIIDFFTMIFRYNSSGGGNLYDRLHRAKRDR